MDSVPVISDDYSFAQTTTNILQMDLLVEGIKNSSPSMVQSYAIQQLDDTHFQLISCENEETFSLHLTSQSMEKVGLGNSENVPVIRSVQQDSVIQHSSSVLKPANSNQQLSDSSKKQIASEDCLSSYSCCSELFDSLSAFRQHLKMHITEEKFSCSICQARFLIENNLKIHMITSHPGDSNVCPICKVSFQRKASLRSHALMHQEEELFPCKQCEEEFQNYDELLKHMEDHALIKKPIDSLLCRYCKMRFETGADYNEHVAKHKEVKKNILKDKKVKKRANRNDRKRFKCKYCSKAFPKCYLLDRHERIHTGEKPFKCEICNKGFAQTNSLKFHLDKHKGLRPYCCTLCPAKFTQKGNLRAHVEKTHTAPKTGHRTYKCSQCACIFKKIASLNGHITKVHINNEPEESSDPQSIINKVVNGLRELNNDDHRYGSKEDKLGMSEVKLAESQVTGGVRRYAIRQKKIGEVRWYFCNYCTSKFKKPSDLIRHFRTHTLEKPFKCVKCEQNFSLKATLNSHLKTHNRPEAECNHCDTTFKNRRNFKAHVRNHEAAKAPNYVCRFCEKVFATFEEGKDHISAHEGEIQSTDNIIEPLLKQPLFQTTYGTLELKPPKSKVPNTNTESALESPHHCKTCGARFTRLMSLKRHIMHHNGERKFKCTICPKAFVTNYELKEHLKYHNNIKNYGCATCGKKFSTSSLLKRHTIIHGNAESYMCPYCSKHFKTSALCRAHIKNIHQAMTGEEFSVIKQPEKLTNEASSSSNESVERSSEVLLSIAPENQHCNTPAELPSNYQMVYLDIGDMPTNNSAEILNQDGLISSINLFNPLDSLQESATVFFSIDSDKPDNMVDPNEVLKFTKLDKTDELAGAQPVQLDEQSEAPLVANLASDQGLYTVNLSELPISIINASESTSLMNNDIISGDPPVICINCHKMFASCSVFENHLCSAETARAVQGSLELIIQGANPDIVENKILNDKDPIGNAGDIVIHSSEAIDEMPENINIYETQLLNNTSAPDATLDLSNMKRYVNKKSQQSNVNNLDQTKQLSCKHCNFTAQSEDQYRKHLFLHPDLSDKICKFCCKDFTKPSDLKRHLRTHTGEKPFECDQCHKKFSLKSTLESHFRTHNMPGVSKITCDVCNANFTSKSSLKVHMLLHTGAKPYGCRFCEQMFRTPATRKTHEKNQHTNNQVEAPNPPKLAGVKLIKYIAEQMAASVENDLKKYENPEVKEREQEPVETVDSQQLNWVPMDSTELFHQLQPYGIIISSEADANVSRTMEDLTVLDVHNDLQLSTIQEESIQQTTEVQNPKPQKNQGLKPKVQCDICHKWYSTKNVLRKHKKMLHVQDKKFPCIKCDKGYDQLEELNKHIAKLHSGHRPNTCQYCSNSFGEEGSLKTHIKRIHQKSLMGEETTNAILGLQYDLTSDLFV